MENPGCAEPTAAFWGADKCTGVPHRGQFACERLGESGKPHAAHFICLYLRRDSFITSLLFFNNVLALVE
jgi:hypothetical protein